MKYVLLTLGCKVNAYESEAVKQLLDFRGYSEASEKDADVDVAVINTCSVTSTSDQKSRQMIRRLVSHYPNAVIVAMGCYVQMSAAFVETIPGVDIIIGTSDRHMIPDLVEQYLKDGKKRNIVAESTRDLTYEELKVTSYSDNTRAYLKIQDGCDNFCSYCIIPFARGRLRSRQKEAILQEVHQLVDAGFQEIVLTGIHTGGYGRDLGNYSFTDLVKDILKEEPRLYRLRISSIEESEITDELISLMKTNTVIAHHLHMPIQSGSNGVLKRMNRKYDVNTFLSKVKAIRRIIPDVALTTDVIVGFPGETEEEFNETVKTLKEADFSMLHVFPFSARSGTPAARYKDQIDPSVKKARVKTLLDLSMVLYDSYQKRFLGQKLSVLFEDFDESSKSYRGHSSNYLLIHEKSQEDLRGKIRLVTYKY